MSIDWASLHKICLGMMLMPRKDFWDSTPKELQNAIDGFKRFHGAERPNTPMDRDRMHELMELYPDE